MSASFDDHFSAQAPTYASFRPRYPDELYAFVASLAPGRARALDCGTGNGQAAVDLARHFDEVVAIDPSSAQIENAIPHDRVHYAVAPAEATGLDDASVDLVACAQSIHWFDFDRFYDEVRRVLKPRGVMAAWTYHVSSIAPEIDAALHRYFAETLDGFWSPKIDFINDHYRTLPFPFAEIDTPSFAIETPLTSAQLLGFVASWSATRAYREAKGVDPIVDLAAEVETLWGSGERMVRWPLYMRVGRVSA